MNCEIKSAEICFSQKLCAKNTLRELKIFKKMSKSLSADELLNALINAIEDKIGGKEGICVKIGVI